MIIMMIIYQIADHRVYGRLFIKTRWILIKSFVPSRSSINYKRDLFCREKLYILLFNFNWISYYHLSKKLSRWNAFFFESTLWEKTNCNWIIDWFYRNIAWEYFFSLTINALSCLEQWKFSFKHLFFSLFDRKNESIISILYGIL